MTFPSQPPVPYQPFAIPSPLRTHYLSLVQVKRLRNRMVNGSATLTWHELPGVIDPFVNIPGQMMCLLQIGMIKRTDLLMPLTAGAAPQRQGTAVFDAVLDPDTGAPFVLAGDRLFCIAGPVAGTFEIKAVPQTVISFGGAHHVEVSIWEVAKSIAKGSQTPFPGSENADT